MSGSALATVEEFSFTPEGKAKAEALAAKLKSANHAIAAIVWVRMPTMGRNGGYRVVVPSRFREGVLTFITREKANERTQDKQK